MRRPRESGRCIWPWLCSLTAGATFSGSGLSRPMAPILDQGLHGPEGARLTGYPDCRHRRLEGMERRWRRYSANEPSRRASCICGARVSSSRIGNSTSRWPLPCVRSIRRPAPILPSRHSTRSSAGNEASAFRPSWRLAPRLVESHSLLLVFHARFDASSIRPTARERARAASQDHKHPRLLPNRQAATRLIWLVLRNITATWARGAIHWRAAMNQFAILTRGGLRNRPCDEPFHTRNP